MINVNLPYKLGTIFYYFDCYDNNEKDIYSLTLDSYIINKGGIWLKENEYDTFGFCNLNDINKINEYDYSYFDDYDLALNSLKNKLREE